jgi:hypothetical protein
MKLPRHRDSGERSDVAGDTLRLDLGEAWDSYAEVIAAAKTVDGSTVLDFGSLGTITLAGVTLSELKADDFVFG